MDVVAVAGFANYRVLERTKGNINEERARLHMESLRSARKL